MDGKDPEILYVSKFPPSRSGVALYASRFVAVLNVFGVVVSEPAPAEPRVAQRFVSALKGLFLAATSIPRSVRLIHIELSGRSLFEFYFALGALVRRRGARVVITCHDPPAIVGPPLLFAELDRHGFRRLGMELSRLLGGWLEHWLLNRSDAVVALTEEGALALERAAGRTVYALPHVVFMEASPPPKEEIIFIPGPVDNVDGICEVVQAAAGTKSGEPWRVVVGACSLRTRTDVLHKLRDGDRNGSSIEFVGYVDEVTLLQIYARARFVVRLRSKSDANRFAASGPLAHAVAAGCICITDDDRAGARELADLGLLIRDPQPAWTLRKLLVDPDACNSPEDLMERMRAYSSLEVTAQRYGALLGDIGFG